MARSKKTTPTPGPETPSSGQDETLAGAEPGTPPETDPEPAVADEQPQDRGSVPQRDEEPVVIAEPTAQSSLEHDGATVAPDTGPPREAGDNGMGGTPVPPVGTQQAPRETRGSGFGGGLIGGVLGTAVVLAGLYAARPDLFAGPEPEVDLSAIDGTLAEQSGRLDGLEERVEEIAARPAAEADTAALEGLRTDLADRIETLAADVEANRAALDVIEGRLAQVEARPPVMEGDAEAATAEVVAEMRAALDAQRAEIERLADEAQERLAATEEQTDALRAAAEASANAAVGRAALARLQAALEAGGPFAGALSDLSGVTQAPIPDALLANADTGVPTLADLRARFPEAARTALDASVRAGLDPAAGPVERIGAFLRTQTGVRSTAPREGDDPDAILSRAEAALAEGRLADALDLIGGLPEAGRAAMADWRAAAETRLAAVDAAETLAAALSEN